MKPVHSFRSRPYHRFGAGFMAAAAAAAVGSVILAAVAAGSPAVQAAAEPPLLSFGVVADIQYTDQADNGVRCYRESIQKLNEAATEFNRSDLAFVIQLGDFIDKNLDSFATIYPVYQKIQTTRYHVLGNHDFAATPDKIVATLGMPGRYYDFTQGDWRFVVLDGSDLSLYANAPYTLKYEQSRVFWEILTKTGARNAQSWDGAVGEEQLAWLRATLQDAANKGQRVIVFNHFPVLPENEHNLWNDAELVNVLESFKNVVVAYFNGHNHAGNYAEQNGIHYLNFKGMVDTPDTNAFAIVRIYPNRLEIDGFGREPDRTLPLN